MDNPLPSTIIMLQISCLSANIYSQWRIQDFPQGGGANSQNCYYFSHFCRKLHENERIWTPRGGARPWRPPLDPPMTVADPGFPRPKEPTPVFWAKPINWQDFCRKLLENERNWSKRGRGSLDRPMTNIHMNCYLLNYSKLSFRKFSKIGGSN